MTTKRIIFETTWDFDPQADDVGVLTDIVQTKLRAEPGCVDVKAISVDSEDALADYLLWELLG